MIASHMVIGASVAAGAPPAAKGAMLIVHEPALAAAAESWSQYRSSQGWNITVASCDGGDAETLRGRIRAWADRVEPNAATIDDHDARRDTALGTRRAVLLLGRVSAIPTFRYRQLDPSIVDRRDASFATDGPFQDLDDDGTPDLMLGRIPVATSEHARTVLEKIRAWESAPVRDANRRVELVGGEGRFGPYDHLLEILTSTLLLEAVPSVFELRATYAKATSAFCPPPSRASEIVRDQALSGALLFNYVGHGHATGLDALWWHGGKSRLLEVSDLAPSTEPAAPDNGAGAEIPGGVALLVCCSTGWYDDPARPCLAEALLLHPRAPIAILAGSRPTHPYANAIVERDAVRALLRDRAPTVGAWDLMITRSLASSTVDDLDLLAAPIAAIQKWRLPLRQMRRDHALIYNLIGDPTTAIVHPPASDSVDITIDDDGRLLGVVDMDALAAAGMTHARLEAEVMLVAARTATPAGVVPARKDNDPDLEEIARRNWPRANDRLRWRILVPVIDGRFEAEVAERQWAAADQVVVIVRRVVDEEGGEGTMKGANKSDKGDKSDKSNQESEGTTVVKKDAKDTKDTNRMNEVAGKSLDPAIVAATARQVRSLLRSNGHGQGLPSDRGSHPR